MIEENAPKMLSKAEIDEALMRWQQAWNSHDLDGVMSLFHNDVHFQNWTGATVRGKRALRLAWAHWFSNNGGFQFLHEDVFVDVEEQKALFRWQLDWPSREPGFEGQRERRQGVDVLHFHEGLVIQKLSYSQSIVEVNGNRVLVADSGRTNR